MSARIQLPETPLFLLFFNNSRDQRGFGRKPLKDFSVGKASLCANDKRGELFLFRHGVKDNDNGPIEGSIKYSKVLHNYGVVILDAIGLSRLNLSLGHLVCLLVRQLRDIAPGASRLRLLP